jgi:uncharacterized SAM-binding protein YcdF (DUF218 family)
VKAKEVMVNCQDDVVVAIVLGGGVDKEGGLPVWVRNRLDKAIELFEKGKTKILTTGAYSKRAGPGSKTEAQAMKEYLLQKAQGMEVEITEEDILTEEESFDTIGNAWFSKVRHLSAKKYTSCLVITSDFHIRLAEKIFRWVMGNEYEIEMVETPSGLSETDLRTRAEVEQMFVEYIDRYLIGDIEAGDDEKIGHFIEKEHPRYCLTPRGEAYVERLISTGSIKAGFK